jgi:SAM-dependent methyltransferase
MTALAAAASLFERLPMPDAVSRLAIEFLVGRTSRRLAVAERDAAAEFARAMARRPIAEHVDAANAQHYELPPAFFDHVLGPQRKYSCYLYDAGAQSLAAAEERALAETAAHADLADGQSILELGCGWGSLSLWMARRYPGARIVAVSNSKSQRQYIAARAAFEGLANLDIVTADMNAFVPRGTFDRIVGTRLACPGRTALHPRVQSLPKSLRIRASRQGRLDHAALLHRWCHAEPRPHPPLRRPVHGRGGMALGWNSLRADPARLARQFRSKRGAN